jgi:hypothetical protein
MTADTYLQTILLREAVDTGPYSPVRGVITTIQPHVAAWAGRYLMSLNPSGSFAKGTANKSGTDIDLFLSLSSETPETLKQVFESLFQRMTEIGGQPRRQNVSINVKVNGYSVDLVPAKQQNALSQDHSLYRRKADSWTKTNIATHIAHVLNGRRQNETRVLKLWRNQNGLDFPSFYLELAVIAALFGRSGSLSGNVWKVFEYLRDTFPRARLVDPANTNNMISDDLSEADRMKIKSAAESALKATDWSQIVK